MNKKNGEKKKKNCPQIQSATRTSQTKRLTPPSVRVWKQISSDSYVLPTDGVEGVCSLFFEGGCSVRICVCVRETLLSECFKLG